MNTLPLCRFRVPTADPQQHHCRCAQVAAPRRLVSSDVCQHCTVYDTCDKVAMLGFGDLVAKVTQAVGVKPCGGCGKRQQILNKVLPFS